MALGLVDLRAYQPAQRATHATLESIPDGLPGIDATLARMKQLVLAAKMDPAISEHAIAIKRMSGVPDKYWPGEARAIHAWVQGNISYVRDVRDVETLRTPAETLRLAAGDCDDQAMLVSALLESIGHRTRFRAVAFSIDPLGDPNFEHVYTQVMIPDRSGPKWYALETTEPLSFGQDPPGVVGARIKNI